MCPAATAPAKSLTFPKIKITIPSAAEKNANPKEVLIFKATDAIVKPAKVPSIFTHENHIAKTPSFPGGEQSSNRTRLKACSIPADVPCNAAKVSMCAVFQFSPRW